jgi:hypothetical protein
MLIIMMMASCDACVGLKRRKQASKAERCMLPSGWQCCCKCSQLLQHRVAGSRRKHKQPFALLKGLACVLQARRSQSYINNHGEHTFKRSERFLDNESTPYNDCRDVSAMQI